MPAKRSEVTLYTLSGCYHCARARDLLRRRGVVFEEVNGDGERGFGDQLLELTGRLTVPQILIGGEPIGGASELARLDRRGLLVPLACGEAFPWALVRRQLNLVGLLAAPFGGSCGLWRYRVELVERDGTVLQRMPVRSAEEAVELAMFMNEREGVA